MHTRSACLVHHSLVDVLREDEVGRRAGQRADASDVGGVGDADAHGFTNHPVLVTCAGSCRLTLSNLQDNAKGGSPPISGSSRSTNHTL